MLHALLRSVRSRRTLRWSSARRIPWTMPALRIWWRRRSSWFSSERPSWWSASWSWAWTLWAWWWAWCGRRRRRRRRGRRRFARAARGRLEGRVRRFARGGCARRGAGRSRRGGAFAFVFFQLGQVRFGRFQRRLGLFERHFGALRVERGEQLPLGDFLSFFDVDVRDRAAGLEAEVQVARRLDTAAAGHGRLHDAPFDRARARGLATGLRRRADRDDGEHGYGDAERRQRPVQDGLAPERRPQASDAAAVTRPGRGRCVGLVIAGVRLRSPVESLVLTERHRWVESVRVSCCPRIDQAWCGAVSVWLERAKSRV